MFWGKLLTYHVLFAACCLAVALEAKSKSSWNDYTSGSSHHHRLRIRTREGASEPACSIYILDLAEMMGKSAGVPTCNLTRDTIVNPANGIVVLKKGFEWLENEHKGVPHTAGQHASPYYLAEAIRSSAYHTTDPAKATVILVDDYCHLTWWLAHAHTKNPDNAPSGGPGADLNKLYDELVKSDRWKDHGGKDFAFYQPHPGYGWGDDLTRYRRDYICGKLAAASYVVVENAQRLRLCDPNIGRDQYILAPYSSTTDIGELRAAETNHRDILLHFIGHCTGPYAPVGKRMRQHVAAAIAECRDGKGGPCTDVHVECIGENAKGEISHADLMRDLSRTSFCLVTPGDSQSSRRLTEVMMAMCIPVFLGSPFHTIPFASKVNYKELGIFLEMGDADAWLGDSKKRAVGGDEWWPNDIDLSDVAVPLAKSNQIVSYLRALPADKVAKMRAAVGAARSRFQFKDRMGHPPGASDTIAELLCEHGQQRFWV